MASLTKQACNERNWAVITAAQNFMSTVEAEVGESNSTQSFSLSLSVRQNQ
jgi:hypothetical protein